MSPTSRRGERTAPPTPAVAALLRAGVAHTLHPYDHDPGVDSYGEEAAAVLDRPAEQVLKTLVASVDGRLAVAVVPVCDRLDLKALARALGGSKATMADPHAAERATGYVVGGISPLGQRRTHPTVVDDSALAHDTVLVSAGRRGLDVELSPTDLVRLTSALVARIRRGG